VGVAVTERAVSGGVNRVRWSHTPVYVRAKSSEKEDDSKTIESDADGTL